MKQPLCFAALLAVLVAGSAHAAPNTNDTVVNRAGAPATTKFGTCVITKWDGKGDPCAPKKAEVKPVTPPPAPVPVAAPKPPAPQIALEQRTILFDFDKSDIKPAEKQKLDALVTVIQSTRGIKKASVIGYADMMGSQAHNIPLSERRAAAVNQYLASKVSIPTEVADVRGLGAANGKTNCAHEKKRDKRILCLAQDRRVEIELTYEK